MSDFVEPVVEIHEANNKKSPSKNMGALSKRDNHICIECNKSFSTLQRLKKHVSVIHELKIFQCEQCDETFDSANKLKKHKIQFKVPRIIVTSAINHFLQMLNW